MDATTSIVKATLHFPAGSVLDPLVSLFSAQAPFARCQLTLGTDQSGRPTAAITSPYEVDSPENDEILGRAMAVGCGTDTSYVPPECPACRRKYRQRNHNGNWRCLDCGHKYRKD